MNKIIPVLSLIVAALGLFLSLSGLIALSVSVQAGAAAAIAVSLPFVIAGAIITATSAVITFFFRLDRLCFIAFFINIGGVALSVVSVIIWFAAV